MVITVEPNKRYLTRSGSIVYILAVGLPHPRYTVCGYSVHTGEIHSWDALGRYNAYSGDGAESVLDIVEEARP